MDNYVELKTDETIQKGDEFKCEYESERAWRQVKVSIGTTVSDWNFLHFRRKVKNKQLFFKGLGNK
jgi:hypothetical protein